MFELKVVTHFAAAHQLQMVGQKCENLHGHNWKIEVYVKGEKLDDAGVLLDFGDVKKHVRAMMAEIDHKFLNDLPVFDGKQPTSERIALYISKELQRRLGDVPARVSRVTAWESHNAAATYIAEEAG